MRAVIDVATIDALSEPQLRELTARLITEVRHKQATIEKLTHEMAVLKRLKFAARSEAFTGEQKSLLEEAIDADLEALSRELEREQPTPPGAAPKEQPKRQPLAAHWT
jgi:C4-dicarboxylate-specific signal transduction histidine kinase